MKKSKSRPNPWITKLFFILPVLIIVILVVYAYVNLNSPGTLMVRAENDSCLTAGDSYCQQLQVQVSVNSMTGETPWTLSLAQGDYVVKFTTIQWYYSPASRDVALQADQTEYAVAVYQPIARVIAVTSSGFNATAVTALHGTTPVIWINSGSSPATFNSPLGRTTLQVGQNLTYIFSSPGRFTYQAFNTNQNVTVTVQ